MNRQRAFAFARLIGAVLALVVSGCRSTGDTPLTASGFPEVIVRAATPEEVLAELRAYFIDRGYVERPSRHEYEVVFDKPDGNPRSRQALRVRVRMYGQPDASWRLVGAPMGVADWRSDLESERVLIQGASQIHGFLAEIKTRVESR